MADSPQVDAAQCAEAVRVCACLAFRKAARAITQLFDGVLQPSGLRSTQFVVLVAIQAREGGASLPELAQALQLDRSTLTRNLAPLERTGLLRVESRRGERARYARLTPAGLRLVNQAAPLWAEAQGRFVAQLGKRKWKSMLGDLSTVIGAAEDA